MIYPCSHFTAKIWVKYARNKWQSGERKYGTILEHDDKMRKCFPYDWPLVRGIYRSSRASDANLWYFHCCVMKAVETTVEVLVFWDGMMLVWCRFNLHVWLITNPLDLSEIVFMDIVHKHSLRFVVFCCVSLQCTHIIQGCFIGTGVALTESYRICPDTS